MKNIIYIASISLLSFNSIAQKCKEAIDPITNEKKYEFNFVDSWGFGTVIFENKNGKTTLTRSLGYKGAMNVICPAGSEIVFKLDNGEVIKLKTLGDVGPTVSSIGIVVSSYNLVMSITKDDMNKFASSKLVFMRVPKIVSEGYSDLDGKDWNVSRSKKALKKGAACMSMQ